MSNSRMNARWTLQLLLLFLGLCHRMKVVSSGEDSTRCIEKERQALLAFKQSVIDDFDQLSSWGSKDGAKDCCLWEGIRCSNKTGHVISLHLFFSLLRGKLNPSLLQLRHLRYLDLSFNDFRGSQFPSSNGSSSALSKLRYLNLCTTGLNLTTVFQLGNLTNLQFLDLSYNGFDVFNLDGLYGLSSLRYLNLSGNNLKGIKDWPQLLYKLPCLEQLWLSECSLPRIFSPPSPSPNINSSGYQSFFNFTTNIVDLHLNGNSLDGSISYILRNMNSLEHLDLSGNRLEGGIPQFLGNICTLKTLDLSNNSLTGFNPVLSGCIEHSLEILRLLGNHFHDPLMVLYFSRFSSLKELDLSHNGLNGSLPKSFEQPSKLEFLYLPGNQLTGSLPDFTTLSSLKVLDISDNQMNGTLTEISGSISEIEYLDVSGNSLQGVISETHFQNLTKLTSLDLSSNHLTLSFSSGWLPPFQLQYAYLSSCKLGPHFPKWLQTQKNLLELDISSAGISDTIPDWLWELTPYLSRLNLSENQMTGKLPNLSTLESFVNIDIDLSSNLFEGPLPLIPSNVISLNLAKNKFSGSISPLCKTRATFLKFLDVFDNLLSGVLPNCSVFWQALRVLNLANNNFSGAIPSTFGSLKSLETMNVRNNSFSEDLPSSLKNCSSLKFLDLSENKLSGNIPAWVGESLSSLIFLSIQANEFTGKIPANICQLTAIRILDLSQNQLSGTIPSCLNNLIAMSQKDKSSDIIEFDYWFSMQQIGNGYSYVGNYIEKALVGWKGKTYEYERYLGLFRIIDLADNQLIGEIPNEITNLSELVVLNLSRNNLIGFIPRNIGHMKQIQSLDLSYNHLSGRIPTSMADLNFLSYLDLSYDNLSGRIPSSTQLLTIDPSAFVGNQALCGPPVTNQCPEDNKRPAQATNGGNAYRDEFSKWFYAGMGLGFCLGFWGICGSLLLKRSWRHAYFRLLDQLRDSLYVTFMIWKARLQRKLKS